MSRLIKLQLLSFFSLLLFLSGCSVLRDLSNQVRKPVLSVQNVQVTGYDFNQVELTYDISVDNPNTVSVRMRAYDYTLDINENTLLSGNRQEEVEIEASGSSIVQVPVVLNFSDVYNLAKSLRDSDEAQYAFSSSLTFDLPVLGETEVPVNRKGTIPLLKRPDIRIEDISVSDLGFSSAEVNIRLRFDNPNGFGINVNRLNYDLSINGDRWAEGTALEGVDIRSNGVTELDIPISLNISKIGMSAYRILTGSGAFDYQVEGNFDISPRHELLGRTTFDFDRGGRLSLPAN